MYQHIINLMRNTPSANFRPPRPTKTLCERHGFSLKPRSDRHPHPHNFSLSLCAPRSASSSKPAISSRCQCSLNCAVFNQDRSHASPAFILRSQKGHYGQQRETLRVEHELKVRYYSEEKSELNVPKPKSTNNYCSVCHTAYEDYLEHTNSTLHTNRLRKSPFNQHILDLALQISQQAQAEESASLLSPNKLQESTEGVDSQVEIVDVSKKKVKEDSPTPNTQSNLPAGSGNVNQRSHLMGWVSQATLPTPAQITALLSHQMFLSQYLTASSQFPLISPLYHPAMHPYPLYRVPPPPPYHPLPSAKPITCIVIDD